VLYHFEALTGLNIHNDSQRQDILAGVEIFRGTIADAYLLRGGNRMVVVVSDDQRASILHSMLPVSDIDWSDRSVYTLTIRRLKLLF
jgi:hypothetical protein